MTLTTRLVFVALGNSLTRGFVPYNPYRPMTSGISYTSILGNLAMTDLFSRSRNDVLVEFLNFGMNGDSTQGMLQRLGSHVAPKNPDYVIIWGGINDLFGRSPPEVIMENLKTIYAKTMEIGAQPVACTLTSVTGFDDVIPSIKTLNGMIVEYCFEESNLLADLFTATSDDEGRLLEVFSSDGVHLTAAGNERVAQAIYYDVVNGILERLYF